MLTSRPRSYFNLRYMATFMLGGVGGYPGMTLKDLRRASLYWLGHYSSVDLVALKNHARHRNVETTSLYTRRPLEDVSDLGGDGELNLD